MPSTRDQSRGRYADVGAVHDAAVTPTVPTLGCRDDRSHLLYPAEVNLLIGDAGIGKSFLACRLVSETLAGAHRRALVIDLDGNGPENTVPRMVALGSEAGALRDGQRFRYALLESAGDVAALVEDAAAWRPTLAVVDPYGAPVDIFAGDLNSADDVARIHRLALRPYADTGSFVLLIAHLSRSKESRDGGPSGHWHSCGRAAASRSA